MDPLTHALLGATIGQAMFSRHLGRRAMVWGAVANVIPDLDMAAASLGGPLGEFRYHRGLTHTFWFGLLVGPLMGYLVWRLHARAEPLRWRVEPIYPGRKSMLATWMALFAVALVAHPLLDLFTTYGTQLLWPFSHRRFAWNAVAIVDPLYTSILLASTLCVWARGVSGRERRIAAVALMLSSLYLGYGVWLNRCAQRIACRHLDAQGVAHVEVNAYPTLLQPWLRRLVVRSEDEVRVGLVSLWTRTAPEWKRFIPQEHPLIDALRARPEGRLFEWFAMGQTSPRVTHTEVGYVVEIEDLRYSFSQRPDEGLWGIRAAFDREGHIRGTIERFNRPPVDLRAQVARIWRATFG